MICVALAVGTGFEASLGEQYGIFVALLVVRESLRVARVQLLLTLFSPFRLHPLFIRH